jgi:purine-nucleoside phosphorylase
MPARLRPTAPIAADAILVGDPGRALLLAQELLEQPKMSNHARGLWGYSGTAASGNELTIQATGMGGPSAAMVLADLAELGVRRVVRVGTCAGLDPAVGAGALLVVEAALGAAGSAASFGIAPGEVVAPDPALLERLRAALGEEAKTETVVSFDTMPTDLGSIGGATAADMQTLVVFAQARALRIAAAAVLIATETGDGERLAGDELERLAAKAGKAAAESLSNLQVEG